MSLAKKAIKNGSWFAFFKSISQVISWVVTIIVARILSPSDYALSAMATLVTGYAEIFSEMGIGASIIQKKKLSSNDLSSIFWFSFCVSILFAAACFPVAYLTAEIFNEPQVVPLVQAVSILFIFTGLAVVPLSLLKRDLDYKTIGLIEMQSTIIACLGMLLIAYGDGGVWTLIGGRIIRGFVRLLLVYRATKWRPTIHFNFEEAKIYLRFGVVVALSSSVFYVFEISDRFFAGRAWELEMLGYYLFAMQLAKMATDKIVSTINHVTYSLFSRYQDDKEKFNEYYLSTVKITALLAFPVFVMGFMFGDDLIPLLLGNKWLPMITLFEFLCLVQIITTLNAIVNYVHMAIGKPMRGLYFYAACAFFMSISFYFAVQYEKEMILIPWFTTYLLITLIWLVYTNRKLGITNLKYIATLISPVAGVSIMYLVVVLLRYSESLLAFNSVLVFAIEVIVALLSYFIFLWFFDRNILQSVKSLKAR